MRRLLPTILMIAAVVCLLLSLASCGSLKMVAAVRLQEDTVYETEVGDTDVFSSVSVCVTYTDGSEEVLPLSLDMIPSVEILKIYKPGRQTIRVQIDRQSCDLTVFVRRATMDGLTLGPTEQEPIVYNGEPHTVTVSGDLPEGAEVRYPNGNIFTNAGTHEVTAVVVCDGYEAVTLTNTLTIEKACYDVSDIAFADCEEVYTGHPVMPEASGVPEDDLFVSYVLLASDGATPISEAVNAGQYYVRMDLACRDARNYYPSEESRTISLKIDRATYDMSGVEMKDDDSVVYDGKAHGIKVTGDLPAGVSVRYTARRVLLGAGAGTGETEARNAGIYLITAEFTGDNANYEPIPDMHATLKISKAVIELTDYAFDDGYCDFDGEIHTHEIVGDLPEDVVVTYTYNGEKVAGVRRAGQYTVVATLRASDSLNYEVIPARIERTLIIREIVGSADFRADRIFFREDAAPGEPAFRLVGVPDGIRTEIVFRDADGKTVAQDALERGKAYDFTASFTYEDEDWQASATLPNVTGTVTLRIGIELEEYTFADTTVTYDGEAHALSFGPGLPDDAVIYENNGKTEVGTYQIYGRVNEALYCLYTKDGRTLDEEVATLTIAKRKADLRSFGWKESVAVTYDGESHSLELLGAADVPAWVSYTVENNGKTDAGTYAVTITIDYDRASGEVTIDPGKLTATLRIMKRTVDLSPLTMQDLTVTYDRTEHEIVLTGDATIPSWVTVQYTDNKKTDAGVYTATAHFVYDAANNDIGTTDRTATLTINKAEIDLSKIDFSDQVYTYEKNKSKQFYIDRSSLPDDVSVLNDTETHYLCCRTFIIKFTGKNYVEATRTVKLVVNPSIDCLTFTSSHDARDGWMLSVYANKNLYNGETGVTSVTLLVTGQSSMSATYTLAPGTYNWVLIMRTESEETGHQATGTVTYTADGKIVHGGAL